MNRDHADAPSRITDADRERQRAAIARLDRAIAAQRRRERVARLAVCGIAIGLTVAAFYSLSN